MLPSFIDQLTQAQAGVARTSATLTGRDKARETIRAKADAKMRQSFERNWLTESILTTVEAGELFGLSPAATIQRCRRLEKLGLIKLAGKEKRKQNHIYLWVKA